MALPDDLANLSAETLRALLVDALDAAGNDLTNGHSCGIYYGKKLPCSCWKGIAHRLSAAGVRPVKSPLLPVHGVG